MGEKRLKRIVLTGCKGLLGSAFLEALSSFEVWPLEHRDLENHEEGKILELFDSIKPDTVFNCAAHTDLEAAERDPALDYRTNAQLPGLIAVACKKFGVTMVHFSSTGCYGRWKTTPYTEEDALHPTTKHHIAKRDGEDAIRMSGCNWLIFRLGWLYGGAPKMRKNFVWNRLIEAASVSQLSSDASQMGCPTYVKDVVQQSMRVVDADHTGVFNLTAHGYASRFEYVSEIIKASKLLCSVTPRQAFSRLAPVSGNEMALNQRLQQIGLDTMPDWRTPLNAYVQELITSPEWLAS